MMQPVDYNKTGTLEEFKYQLERPNTLTWIWIIFLALLVCLGIFSLIMQITQGHIITGMRDNVVWGIYIVNFIFFMGISYSGALISGSLILFRSSWRKPIIRMAEFITIISLFIGP